VDVLAIFRGRGSPPTTKTVLTDISVFAINDRISRIIEEDDGNTIKAKTVSLTVKPAQAQRLLLAAELGQIKLSLRNNNDNSTESPDESNLDDLGPQGLGGLLSGLKQLPSTIPMVAAVDNTPKFTMEIMSPARMETYRWTDLNSLPEIVKQVDMPSQGGNPNRDLVSGDEPNTADEDVQAESTEKQDEFWSEFEESREAEKEKLQKAQSVFEKTWNVKLGPLDSVFDE
jgi:hypothetical protein